MPRASLWTTTGLITSWAFYNPFVDAGLWSEDKLGPSELNKNDINHVVESELTNLAETSVTGFSHIAPVSESFNQPIHSIQV